MVIRLLILAAVLAAPAVAAPENFRDSSKLQPIASKITPAATIACSTSAWTWREDVHNRWPDASYGSIKGYTVQPNDVRLSPTICQVMENWLRGKSVPDLDDLATATFAFAHELVHARQITDESVADCTALKELPVILRDRFHVKSQKNRTKIMREALRIHQTAPPEYRVNC